MIYLEFNHNEKYVETVVCIDGLPIPHTGDTVTFHNVDYKIQATHFSYAYKEDWAEPHKSVSVVYSCVK